MDNSVISSIPTEYRGIQLRSRFEAQAALLFDHLKWGWQYEPKSLMLPNGICYTPDFWIPEHGLVVECRGYDGDKSRAQVNGMCDLIDAGVSIDGVEAVQYLALWSPVETVIHHRRNGGDELGGALFFCNPCGRWVLVRRDDPRCGICREDCFEKAAYITLHQGRILLNMRQADQWGGVL